VPQVHHTIGSLNARFSSSGLFFPGSPGKTRSIEGKKGKERRKRVRKWRTNKRLATPISAATSEAKLEKENVVHSTGEGTGGGSAVRIKSKHLK
jgi:hypothetical protein